MEKNTNDFGKIKNPENRPVCGKCGTYADPTVSGLSLRQSGLSETTMHTFGSPCLPIVISFYTFATKSFFFDIIVKKCVHILVWLYSIVEKSVVSFCFLLPMD